MPVQLDLPSGLTARPARCEDLPAVHSLVGAYEQRVLGEVLLDLEDLEADWQRPGFDAEADSAVVLDRGRVVAWGEVFRGRRATVAVHPDTWGRGIGTALVEWSVRVAASGGGTLLGQTVPDADEAATTLLRAHSWSPRWTSWVLELPDGQAIAERPPPAGYALRALQPGQDEQAAYDVVETAFAEWPDREPTSYGDWAAAVLARPGFEPWHLLLAVHGQHVVGACHLVMSRGTGWVNQLAVARAHRGRGLGQCLLAAAYDRAREHGAPRGELSTDSRTGALSLYERLGMRVKSSFTHWAREVEPAATWAVDTTAR